MRFVRQRHEIVTSDDYRPYRYLVSLANINILIFRVFFIKLI